MTERQLSRGDEVGVSTITAITSIAPERSAVQNNRVADLADDATIARKFAESRPQRVVNLAAQGGVRYSIQNPRAM